MADGLIPLDIFMLTGQSNAVGRGYNDPDYLPNLPRIEYPIHSHFMPDRMADNGAQPDNGAPEGSIRSAFVNRWRQQTGRAVGFWKYGVGGTSLFADCQPIEGSVQWWEPTVKPTLFDTACGNFNTYTPSVIGYGYEPHVRAMIWIQGENEAEYWVYRWPTEKDALVNRYANGLIELITAYRNTLGYPVLPMWIPYLGSHSNPVHVAGYGYIREAQDKATTMDPHVKICFTRTPEFWTDVPPKTFDGVHYSQTGYNEMGAAIADWAITELGIPLNEGPTDWPADLADFASVRTIDMDETTSLALWDNIPEGAT